MTDDQRLPGVGVVKTDQEGPQGQFGGTDGNILYLDSGDDYMSMWMCQNTLKYRLKWADFNVCELYLNKVDFFKTVSLK